VTPPEQAGERTPTSSALFSVEIAAVLSRRLGRRCAGRLAPGAFAFLAGSASARIEGGGGGAGGR